MEEVNLQLPPKILSETQVFGYRKKEVQPGRLPVIQLTRNAAIDKNVTFMEIKITGDPGTGNSYTEVKVTDGGIYQNLPNVTSVNNTTIIYGNGKTAPSGGNIDDREKQILKTAILDFVGKLKTYVAAEWANKYDTLWVSVLAIPDVDAAIYDKGRLHNTLFNRALVGGIVKVMLDNGVFVESVTPTELAPLVLSGCESFRKEMGKYPSDEIRNDVIKLIEGK